METNVVFSITSCTIVMDGKEYEALKSSYEGITKANLLGKKECIQHVLKTLADMLKIPCYDNNELNKMFKTENRNVSAKIKPKIPACAECDMDGQDEHGCFKAVIQMDKAIPMDDVSTIKDVINNFKPYTDNWIDILNRIMKSSDGKTTAARCIPYAYAMKLKEDMAEVMAEEGIKGVKLSFVSIDAN